MSEEQQQQRFLAEAKAALDEHARQLDGVTQIRLSAARRRALAGGPALPRWPLPAALAAALLASLMVWHFTTPGLPEMMAEAEDLELLMSEEDIEFYEDMEFYQWLADAKAG